MLFDGSNFIFTDGDFLYAFVNERTQLNGKAGPSGLHFLVRDIHSDLAKTKITGIEMNGIHQEQVFVASMPLTGENWLPLQRNHSIRQSITFFSLECLRNSFSCLDEICILRQKEYIIYIFKS